MRRPTTPWRLVVAVAVIAAGGSVAVALVAGCGSATEPVMPQLSASASPGPKPGEATISIAASGAGIANSALVLTHPDGHSEVLVTGQYSHADSSESIPSNLSKGAYTYTVYAIPAENQNAPSIGVGYFTADNVVASGAFTIQ
jgi:hypothetical protein